MSLTLSADHRIIDGVVGARFLTHLVRVIESPILMNY
jgi:pyruvate/2-oxoglutarate dehydrogenase complex dihydrolipoamide acyltransferase (E2) component